MGSETVKELSESEGEVKVGEEVVLQIEEQVRAAKAEEQVGGEPVVRSRSRSATRWLRSSYWGLVYFQKNYKIGIIEYSFVFDKYCSIMD